MYHVYSIPSITVNIFSPIHLEVINRNVVSMCSCRTSHNTPLPISDLIKVKWSLSPLKGSPLNSMQKYAVFQADIVRWGKYSTGRYNQIGVYRVNLVLNNFTYTLYAQVKHTTILAKYPEAALM